MNVGACIWFLLPCFIGILITFLAALAMTESNSLRNPIGIATILHTYKAFALAIESRSSKALTGLRLGILDI